MFNSESQTINKPLKLTPRKSKEEMTSYPEHYYKEIVEFVKDSRNWGL